MSYGETMQCPKCGEGCDRDEVDVGVGVIYGPWGCHCCGWSQSAEYDRSEGPSPKQQEMPNHYVDPCGGATPHRGLANKLSRFGLNGPAVVREVFGDDA